MMRFGVRYFVFFHVLCFSVHSFTNYDSSVRKIRNYKYPATSRTRSALLRATPILNTTNVASENITIIERTNDYLVVLKPPSVVCHHSDWTGSRSRAEVPMLQRVREALNGRRVNLIHRLDRGCSGCLLMAYADRPEATKNLIEALASDEAQKTYVALVRGEGILHGRDFKNEGWFKVDRPIKNENGVENTAVTWFRFVAGQDNAMGSLDRPRASLVLARPQTGRWHQIRKHLNGLSHPILGDSTHGNSKVNREWRKLGMLPERTCLHLASLQLPPSNAAPNGIHAICPLPSDMLSMMRMNLPSVLEQATPILHEEGLLVDDQNLPFYDS